MKYSHLIDTILIYENEEEETTLYKFLQDNLGELEAELFFVRFHNKIYIKSREWYNNGPRKGRKYVQLKEISIKDIGLNK